MDLRASTVLLWSRAAALAAVVVSTGTVAHVSASGLLPGPAFFVIVSAITVGFSALALRVPATVARVVVLTCAGQTWIHLALTAAAGHRGDPAVRHATPAPVVPVAPVGRGQTYQDVYDATRPHVAGGGVELPSPFVHLASEMTGAHAPMMALHLLAAALVGLWLAVGERALWAMLAALAGAHRVARLPLLVVLPRLRPRTTQPRVVLRPRLVSRPHVRRGPPVLLAA